MPTDHESMPIVLKAVASACHVARAVQNDLANLRQIERAFFHARFKCGPPRPPGFMAGI